MLSLLSIVFIVVPVQAQASTPRFPPAAKESSVSFSCTDDPLIAADPSCLTFGHFITDAGHVIVTPEWAEKLASTGVSAVRAGFALPIGAADGGRHMWWSSSRYVCETSKTPVSRSS
jgi:hypothetical protein